MRPAEASSKVPWRPSSTFSAKPARRAARCIDLELQSALKCKPEQVQRLRSRSALILSFHDFRATKNLESTLEKMVAIPADFYKIVSTATTLYDNVTMMKFLEKHGDQTFAGRTVHG